jgi:hypothetical protein
LRRLFIAGFLSFTAGLYAGAASAEVDSRLANRSADVTRAYLHTWSTDPRGAITDVRRLYAPVVSFYGRDLTHDGLIREKAQFLRGRPSRHYSVRPGTMRVACEPQSRRCVVRSIIDWRAQSPARKASSSGSSTFEQWVDFAGSRPLVFRESGAVIQQRRPRGGG